MQANRTLSWKTRVARGLAAVVASTVLLGAELGLFAMFAGTSASAQAQTTSPATAVVVNSLQKARVA
jgi:hypothetical protein